MSCRKINRELTAYVSDELSRSDRQIIETHLQSCSSCQRTLDSLEATRKTLRSWADMEPSVEVSRRFEARLSEEMAEDERKPFLSSKWPSRIRAYALIAAACLAVAVYSGIRLLDRKPSEIAGPDSCYGDVQIGFYIAEHESALKEVSFQRTSFPSREPFWIPLRRENLLYYDTISEENGQSGLILKGGNGLRKPSDAKREAEPMTDISDDEILSMDEARKTASFDIVAPAALSEGYRLTLVKKARNKELVQLVYSDGANTISLFEQPVVSEERLSRGDFREYMLRLAKDKDRTAVLGWHTDWVSFNLVGEGVTLPDLMKIADEVQERHVTDGVKQYYQMLYEGE